MLYIYVNPTFWYLLNQLLSETIILYFILNFNFILLFYNLFLKQFFFILLPLIFIYSNSTKKKLKFFIYIYL